MSMTQLLKGAFTLLVCAVAIVFCSQLWRAYVLAPWTRDGRVSAQVIRIAPQVSGQVSELQVIDNQVVHKGDLLYRIDSQAYLLARQQREAELVEAREIYQQRKDQLVRRNRLGDAIAREEIDNAGRDLAVAKARMNSAEVRFDQARLDLQRTAIYAPVDGYVAQLRLQSGDYAVAGETNIFIVDRHSFWVTGYFEETKLPGVRIGADASVKLLGYDAVLQGRVASIGRGIADDNESRSSGGLPAVSPVFSWIRLAQRVPVRIELEDIPDGVELAAGMTASVEVAQPGAIRHWRLTNWLQEYL
jgi:multidrug resistance efflux pump